MKRGLITFASDDVFVPPNASRRALGPLVAISILIGLMMSARLAQAQSEETGERRPLWAADWRPPQAQADGWDWIHLASGEWVKGEIVLMRDFDLEFDSDEFNLVTFDWEDVSALLTERVYTLVLDDMRTSYTGTISMHDGKISVNVGDHIVRFDRSELVAITPSAERELNLWHLRASVSLGFRSGNTDQSELGGNVSLGREGRITRFEFEYNGAYGTLNNRKNTNNHRGRTRFDYFLSPDLYLIPTAFEVFTDEFQNISYRLTPTTGLGYYLIRRPALEWQIRGGTGYQYTRIDSARPGDSKDTDNAAVVFETTIDADLTSEIDLILQYQVQLVVPDTGQTNHHAQATLEIELTSAIDLDVSFIWDRIEDPETESDGRTPDANDFRTTIGLAIDF